MVVLTCLSQRRTRYRFAVVRGTVEFHIVVSAGDPLLPYSVGPSGGTQPALCKASAAVYVRRGQGYPSLLASVLLRLLCRPKDVLEVLQFESCIVLLHE
jgi:hypothetical protein